MNTYQYIGQEAFELTGYGIVKAGEVITVDFVITHPLFKAKPKKEDK